MEGRGLGASKAGGGSSSTSLTMLLTYGDNVP